MRKVKERNQFLVKWFGCNGRSGDFDGARKLGAPLLYSRGSVWVFARCGVFARGGHTSAVAVASVNIRFSKT